MVQISNWLTPKVFSNFGVTGQNDQKATSGLNDYQSQYISDGLIDTNDVKQAGDGDCWAIAGIVGVSQTTLGKQLIKNAIHPNSDGTFNVTFAGSSGPPEHVTKNDIYNTSWSGQLATNTSDIDMRILLAAVQDSMGSLGNLGTDNDSKNLFNLLTGQQGSEGSFLPPYGNLAKQQVTNFLNQMASGVDNDNVALNAGGHLDSDGNISWSGDAHHEVAITNINPQTNSVTYRDPWDTSQEHSVSMDTMGSEMASNSNLHSSGNSPPSFVWTALSGP